jgi:hypothetical protein
VPGARRIKTRGVIAALYERLSDRGWPVLGPTNGRIVYRFGWPGGEKSGGKLQNSQAFPQFRIRIIRHSAAITGDLAINSSILAATLWPHDAWLVIALVKKSPAVYWQARGRSAPRQRRHKLPMNTTPPNQQRPGA